jgi:processive 1,2-diacylglycerol beta-glucosyltransferase
VTFSTNISAGHRRAAEAVATAILAAAPSSEIIERDAMMLMGPGRRRILTDTYLGIIRHRPEFWNYLYHNKLISPGINRMQRIFLARAYESFEAEILAHRPDAVVCTQAIPARIIADLKSAGRVDVPLLAVATDYGIHPYWAHPAIDAYAVPCDRAVEELSKDGVSEGRAHVTGIPVDAVFEHPPSREEARRLMGLPRESSVVLVMGGGNGLGLTPGHVSAIERVPGVDGVVVIAGCHRELEAAIRALPPAEGKFRHVHATVSGIENFYAAADILVSKPGGLTMSEATAMGMPIIMISPLPGQEVRNARFLSSAGAALEAVDESALEEAVRSLTSDRLRLERLAEASRRVGRPRASRVIASLALRLADERASVFSPRAVLAG